MIVGISEAARLSGRHRQTLYDMRDRGELSFSTVPTTGRSGIDMAELCRVFPKVNPDSSRQSPVESNRHIPTTESTTKTDSHDSALVGALQAHIDTLERLLDEKDQRIMLLEDMRAGRQIEAVQPSAAPVATAQPNEPPRRRTLLDRLADGITAALK